MPDEKTTSPPEVRFVIVREGYRVGDDGSVWSCITKGRYKKIDPTRWHRLKLYPLPKSGHLHLRFGKGQKERLVHHLVLEAFVGPCPPGLECRHLDGDPSNNRLSNLCWGTRSENAEDRIRHGTNLNGERNPSAVMTESNVREALAMHQEGRKIKDIAARLGVNKSTIAEIFQGKTWRHVTGLPPWVRRAGRSRCGTVSAAAPPASRSRHARGGLQFPPRNIEDDVYPFVEAGELEIDDQGRVWRVAARRGMALLNNPDVMKNP